MENTARKEYLKAQAAVDTMLLNMSNTLGMIEFDRKGADTWADVGTMRSILDKLTEVRDELNRYAVIRLDYVVEG